MPPENILKACADANPHGFGFASDTETFRTLEREEFIRRASLIPVNENCMIHFRLATHGSVCEENCHPFTMGTARFAHNGVLDVTPHGDMTDSETAFQDVIWPAIDRFGLDSVRTRMAIDSVIGSSRFAILMDGRMRTYGEFYEMNGLMFSNLRFMTGMRYGVARTYGPRHAV